MSFFSGNILQCISIPIYRSLFRMVNQQRAIIGSGIGLVQTTDRPLFKLIWAKMSDIISHNWVLLV